MGMQEQEIAYSQYHMKEWLNKGWDLIDPRTQQSVIYYTLFSLPSNPMTEMKYNALLKWASWETPGYIKYCHMWQNIT
jgi:hypothetical protein